jgi:oligopeptide transport system substrate-binding protein
VSPISVRSHFLRFFLFSSMVILVCGLSSCSSCTNTSLATGGKKVFYSRREDTAKTLDPARQFDSPSSDAVRHVFDSLYMYHYLKRPYTIVPNLAAAMPEYTPDGLTMTVRLRQDIFFQDAVCFVGGKGRQFNAKDVQYSLTRFADASLNDVGSFVLVEGVLKGFDEYFDMSKKNPDTNRDHLKDRIEGIEVVDDFTIKFHLKKRSLNLYYLLAMSQSSIVPHECVTYYGEDFGFHPVGTGPFYLSYRNRRGDMILEKNPKYHLVYPSEGEPGDEEKGLLKDAGKRLPLVDQVIMPVMLEPQPAMLKFLRGRYDWIRIDSDSFTNMATKNPDGSFSLQEQYRSTLSLHPGVDLSTYWLAFNMKHKLLGSNVHLRKALAYALDRKRMVADIYNGRGIVAESIVPATIGSNATDLGLAAIPFDLNLAKEELKLAGYPEGKGLPEFTYLYASGPTLQRQFEFIRRCLAEVGVKLKLESMAYTAYTKKLENADYEITMAGWNADYLDAENFLMLFTKSAIDNHLFYSGGWTNNQFEERIVKVRELTDGPERKAIIKDMLLMIRDDMPVIPIFTYNRLNLTAPWLKNWKRNMGDSREAVYIDIDENRRKEGLSL